eukprot:5634183-Pleurochrysis_carterae.AAC.1
MRLNINARACVHSKHIFGRPCPGRVTCILKPCVHTASHTLTCLYLLPGGQAIICAGLPNPAWACAAVAAPFTAKSCRRAGPSAMARWKVSAPPPRTALPLAAANRATAQI